MADYLSAAWKWRLIFIIAIYGNGSLIRLQGFLILQDATVTDMWCAICWLAKEEHCNLFTFPLSLEIIYRMVTSYTAFRHSVISVLYQCCVWCSLCCEAAFTTFQRPHYPYHSLFRGFWLIAGSSLRECQVKDCLPLRANPLFHNQPNPDSESSHFRFCPPVFLQMS